MALSPKQKSLYWRKWSQVRKILVDLGGFSTADADAERHEIARTALGGDKSSKDFTNRDLDAVLAGFDAILVLENGPTTESRAAAQPVKRLVWAIDQLGLDAAYISSISAAVYNVADWKTLPETQLAKLRFTLTARARQMSAEG